LIQAVEHPVPVSVDEAGAIRITGIANTIVIAVRLVSIDCIGAVVQSTGINRITGITVAVIIDIGAGVAYITDTVTIGIRLMGVGRKGTVVVSIRNAVVVIIIVADIARTIAVGIGLIFVVVIRAVVTGITVGIIV
jgi:hypothetical protein